MKLYQIKAINRYGDPDRFIGGIWTNKDKVNLECLSYNNSDRFKEITDARKFEIVEFESED